MYPSIMVYDHYPIQMTIFVGIALLKHKGNARSAPHVFSLYLDASADVCLDMAQGPSDHNGLQMEWMEACIWKCIWLQAGFKQAYTPFSGTPISYCWIVVSCCIPWNIPIKWNHLHNIHWFLGIFWPSHALKKTEFEKLQLFAILTPRFFFGACWLHHWSTWKEKGDHMRSGTWSARNFRWGLFCTIFDVFNSNFH
jgi:hypothetical protein